ncbi:hypothetical protein [Chitinimonas sp. BJYL2]|uniref:hypothetical protein n=1 Tax=Chitinimonas sp. BJYL2 TaxID=2976696 RepID=UPI0022B2BB30|nr:hypothetical protein [Chitinimonas sp. BJYL2]
MKSLILFLLCTLSSFADAEIISLPDSGVSFDAPSGFTTLSPSELALKYPSNRAPRFAIGNTRRTTSIAYDIKINSLPPDKLNEAKDAFEHIFNRIIPGIEWRDRSIVRLKNRDWIRLELTSRAIDTDIHNIMLITPYRNGSLIFNFNSTKSEFPLIKDELLKSIESISIDG